MAEPIQQASKLLSLPGELRNRIYRFISVQDEPIQITADHIDPRDERIRFAPKAPALAFTCRLAYNDIGSIFFEENTFRFTEQALRANRLATFRRQAGSSAQNLTVIKVLRVFGIGYYGSTFRFTATIEDGRIIFSDISYECVNAPHFLDLKYVGGDDDEDENEDEVHEVNRGDDTGFCGMCTCSLRKYAAACKGGLLDFLKAYVETDGKYKGQRLVLGLCGHCEKHRIARRAWSSRGNERKITSGM